MDKGRGQWQAWMGISLAIVEDGETQAELAARLKWDPSKVSRLASGKQEPKLWEIEAIAKAQERPIDWYRYGPETSRATLAWLSSQESTLVA